MSTQRKPNVNVKQIVTTNTGQIYGVYYAGTAKPLSEDAIGAYLGRIRQEGSLPKDADERLRKLWDTPFRTYEAGEAEPSAAGVAGQKAQDDGFHVQVENILASKRRRSAIQQVIFLADAGTGMSGALTQLMARRAKESYAVYEEYRDSKGQDAKATFPNAACVVPLLIDLVDLEAGQPLEALVRKAFNLGIKGEAMDEIGEEQTVDLLNKYACLLLLEHLDVLLSGQQQGGFRTVHRFMEYYDKHQYIVACHAASYRQQLGPADLHLAPLTEKDAGDILGEITCKQLRSNGVLALALNRKMLSNMLEMKQGWEAGVRSKGQLLKKFTDLSLTEALTDDARSQIEMVDDLLQRVAYAMHSDRAWSFNEQQVMEIIVSSLQEWHEQGPWRTTRDLLTKTMMVNRDAQRRQWRFANGLTQAYFAAEAVAADPTKLQLVLEGAAEPWWRSVLEILVGLVPDPTELFYELADRDALTAAGCIQTAAGLADTRVQDAVIDALLERMTQESSAARADIVVLIGESSHPKAIEALLRALHQEWSSMVVMAIFKAIRAWSERPAEPDKDKPSIPRLESEILRTRPKQTAPVGDVLVQCLKYLRREKAGGDSRIEKGLIGVLDDPGRSGLAKGLSAIALGLGGTTQGGQALLRLSMDEQADDFVAWCGIEALMELSRWEALLTVLPNVVKRARELVEDKRYRVSTWDRHRARAVYLLTWVSPQKTALELINAALKDPSPLVRGYVAEAIARLDLRNARQMMEDLMWNEREPDVLRKAAEALGRIGTEQSIPVLERHLRHERTRTRRAMQRAITEIRERHMPLVS